MTVAFYLPRGKDKEAMMAQKMLVFGVIALLIALLVLIEIPRGSLCELQISQGSLRIVARMACESAG